jgi:(2Fe-2S) ferredoxin
VAEFKKQLKNRAPGVKFRANRAGCLGICDYGPTVAIYPEGIFYVGVEPEDVTEILDAHLGSKKPVERLLLRQEEKKQPVEYEQLANADLFEQFTLQFEKDLMSAGIEAGPREEIPQDLKRLKKWAADIVSNVMSDTGRIGRLLNRVDVSDWQLKNYLNDNQSLKFEDAVAELIIKRILQKVVIRKKYRE